MATGLIFAAVLLLGSQILSLPFSVYSTFVIEEKYGFNKTTPKTFVLDILKGWLLGVLIGAPVFWAVLWFFERTGPMAWAYCWGALTVIQIFLMFIAPVVIMPIFNKFIPLEEGDLKTGHRRLCQKAGIQDERRFFPWTDPNALQNQMHFSRDFGRFRRIVLFRYAHYQSIPPRNWSLFWPMKWGITKRSIF